MTISKDSCVYHELSVQKPNRFRRISPQVIATTVKNLHMVNYGVKTAILTILIPALTGLPNDQNQNESIKMTGAETSWICSIAYLTQILGSLLSGLMADRFGHKMSMIIVNIPFIIGWLMLNQATENWEVFAGIVTLGFAVGLFEVSVYTYHGEICEPSTRGLLNAYTNITFSLGSLIVYILNSWYPWRTVALICLAVPIISAITLCFIPETPHWLLSKNRPNEAEKSLRWLRGWTKKEEIAHEFYALQRHSDRSNSCAECIKHDLQCTHPPPTLIEKCRELKQPQNMKPFIIIILLFFLMHFTGLSLRPFLVQIFKAYDSPMSSDDNVMLLGLSENLANVIFMCLVFFTGKRAIYLTMAFFIFISSLVVSSYGFTYLPSGFNSFERLNQSIPLADPSLNYIPTVCLHVWYFCSCFGFAAMPWMMLSELFSLKARVVASSITVSINYVMGFISKKTYYDLEMALSLPGATLLFSIITGAGLIVMYLILPETEGRTLEDIEIHFSDDSKKLTDRKIAKSKTISSEMLSNQQISKELKDVKVETK